MSKSNEADLFYASIPVFDSFGGLMEPTLYKPLPDDWTIGIADIVQSTKAIRENRYRSVNMAGAAVIAALKNALGGSDFPFVFGGDGASFAVPAQDLARAHEALAATTAWVKNDLGLVMKAALVPVACARARHRRACGPFRALAKRHLRNVLWRRIRVGRWRHAAGRIRGCSPAAGRSSGSHRLVVPVRGDAGRTRAGSFAADRGGRRCQP
jgi:hypothetical protein